MRQLNPPVTILMVVFGNKPPRHHEKIEERRYVGRMAPWGEILSVKVSVKTKWGGKPHCAVV